ncbi:unnamed protein product [Lampetra planeri]
MTLAYGEQCATALQTSRATPVRFPPVTNDSGDDLNREVAGSMARLENNPCENFRPMSADSERDELICSKCPRGCSANVALGDGDRQSATSCIPARCHRMCTVDKKSKDAPNQERR